MAESRDIHTFADYLTNRELMHMVRVALVRLGRRGLASACDVSFLAAVEDQLCLDVLSSPHYGGSLLAAYTSAEALRFLDTLIARMDNPRLLDSIYGNLQTGKRGRAALDEHSSIQSISLVAAIVLAHLKDVSDEERAMMRAILIGSQAA